MLINIITKRPDDSAQAEGVFVGGANNVFGDAGTHSEAFVSFAQSFGDDQLDDGIEVSGFVQIQDADLDNFQDTFPEWYGLYEERATDGRTETEGDRNFDVLNGPERRDFGLNAMLRIENDTSSLMIWHRESERSSAEGGFTPVLQFVPGAIWRDHSTVIEARHTIEAPKNLFLETSLIGKRYEIDPRSRYIFNGAPGEDLILTDWKYGVGTGVRLEERLSWSLEDTLSVTGGVVLEFKSILPKATVDRSDEPGFDATQSGADPDLELLGQGQPFVYYEDVDGEVVESQISNYSLAIYRRYAGYVEGQYEATPDLRFTAGLRIDKDSRYDDLPLSPRLAAIFSPDENLTLKLLFTRAFVNPAPYFGFSSFNGTNYNVPNPDLKPETAQSLELNATYRRRELVAAISGYWNTQDRILYHADDGLDFQLLRNPDGTPRQVFQDPELTLPAGLSQSINGGDGRSIGFDVYGKYDLDRWLSLWASYSFVDYEVTVGGERVGLDALAQNQVRLGSTGRFINERLTVTLAFQWRSSLSRLDGNDLPSAQTDELHTLNAFAQYSVSDWLEVFVQAKNVYDHRYALKGILGPTPQEAFKILGGVRLSLN